MVLIGARMSDRITYVSIALIIVGALSILSGVSAPSWVSSLAVIAFCAPLIVSLFRDHRWRGILVFAAIGLFAIVIETIGLKTGFPYGSFEYVDTFGVSVSGVPLLLPFAYVPLVFGALALAGNRRPLVRIAVSTFILVIIDLVIDPGAVAFGLWRYDGPGIIGGVPLSNFLGWVFSGAIASTIGLLVSSKHTFSLTLHLSFWTGVTLASGLYVSACIGIMTILLIRLRHEIPMYGSVPG